MNIFEERIDPILRKTAKRIEQCPMMQSLVDGTMTDEQFKFYNIQDYQYLLDYFKARATAVGKAVDFYEIRDIMEILSCNYEGLEYCREFWTKEAGITLDEMDRSTMCEGKKNYTSYLLSIANTGDLAALFCAVFPCGRMYIYFAEELMPKCKLDKDNKFYKWIEYYTTAEYRANSDHKLALVNKYLETKSELELNRLIEIIATACNYEILQWEETYPKMETWPLDEIFPKRMLSIDQK